MREFRGSKLLICNHVKLVNPVYNACGGGGSQPEKLAEALEASYGVVERMLGS
jgi:hypothetical protein